MVHCRQCGAEIPSGVKYCPVCGGIQSSPSESHEQPPLPFSPWVPPPTLQSAGAGAPAHPTTWGAPSSLSMTQVAVAIGLILLFLAFVVLAGNGVPFGLRAHAPATSTGQFPPLLGAMDEAILIGRTAWGVAFTDTVERVNNQAPQRGQFYAVGVVIGNKGEQDIALSLQSVALVDEQTRERFTPRLTAWGTPTEIDAGRYQTRFTLAPQNIIAGLIVFDVPNPLGRPRLLVRDLTASSLEYTGMIDLTRKLSE